jgi:hypothetical protein
MKKGILKLGLQCILLGLLFISCKKEEANPEYDEIDKAIALIHDNKPINDTLLRYRKELGADFILCYIISKNNYRRLGFQIIQSKNEKNPPLEINGFYKVETIQGIDVFLESSKTSQKKFHVTTDNKTKELIRKGYLTIDGRSPLIHSKSVDLVFCENDGSNFKILSDHFLYQEEMKARKNNKPFHEEYFYPRCD